MKTIFENNGGTYESQGDYLLPNLTLRDEKQYLIGVWEWGISDTWNKITKYFTVIFWRQEQVTEKLKAENMMLWVQKMNNIRNRDR